MFQHSRVIRLFAVLALLCAAALPATAAETALQYLSGTGPDDAVPWDFFCTDGRQSRIWAKIAVPSCWEQQGFGTYNYGGELMRNDAPLGNEQGLYRREFTVPAAWQGKVVRLVFDGSMTDTSVWINGRSAGPTHSGAFYQFRYDITPLLKFGETNLIEVTVAKTSAVRSINDAERAADYWVFGGIFRPVWLEALPPEFIDRTAIDARADGQFFAELHLGQKLGAGASASARVCDSNNQPVGASIVTSVPAGVTKVELHGQFPGIRTWTAETPYLYTIQFTLTPSSGGSMGDAHRVVQKFGFRTIEVRKNDGIYVNGSKVVLKGINRHCFWPETARTVSRAQSFADARLIKAANMNAVRCSHYPPDEHFLEACDELGLYVLDELAGWQKAYATEPGRRLVGELIRRDVNHPSILFWDNGNEGGWNTDNDGEFAKWDPQRRPVLHPWAVHDEINTKHYPRYDLMATLAAGPEIFMPTEFLHGLYDGGIGAGFRDYWDVMGRSPTVAGGFFWALIDEGVVRSDENGRIDNAGNQAPDGMVGPHREPEGSYFAVKEIWSPVQAALPERLPDDFDGRVKVENDYDFTNLSACKFAWKLLRFPEPTAKDAKAAVVAGSEFAGPDVAPRKTGEIVLPTGAKLAEADALHLTAKGPKGEELWTWSATTALTNSAVAKGGIPQPVVKEDADAFRIKAGTTEVAISKTTGLHTEVRRGAKSFSLTNGPRLIAMRRNDRQYEDASASEKVGTDRRAVRPHHVAKISCMAGDDVRGAEVSVRYDPEDMTVDYGISPDGSIHVEYRYDFAGTVDLLGVRFDYPETKVKAKRWLGRGPYRVYQNRLGGGVYDVHTVAYNDPIPGQTYAYPEFKGCFSRDWRWLELETTEGRIVVENNCAAIAGEIDKGALYGRPYLGLFGPKDGDPPMLTMPDVGLAFLDVIPAIGTKFNTPETLGPQSQPRKVNGVRQGSVTFRFLPE